MLEVRVDQQKISRYWRKYAFLGIAYSLSIFSVGYIKTPWSDVPSLVAFVSAFIVDETSIFCLSCFEVTTDGRSVEGRRNLRHITAKFLGVG